MRATKKMDDSHLRELKRLWDRKRRTLGIPEPAMDLTAIDLEVQRECLQQEGAAISRDVRQRTPFTSANSLLDFEFFYPAAWQIQEFEREGHSEVFILGPKDRDNVYSLAIAVHVFPTQEQEGKHATIAEVVAAYLKKSGLLPNFQKISRVSGSIADAKAAELVTSYTLPLPLNSVNLKDIAIVERRIILKRKGHFYELIYRAVEEDYYMFLPAFKTMVHTFKFRGNGPETRDFYPLVSQVPHYIAQEEDADYEAPHDTNGPERV